MEFVQAAVEFIGPALGGNLNLRAGLVAVFGRNIIGDDFELGHRLDGRLQGLRLSDQWALNRPGGIVDTVHQDGRVVERQTTRAKASFTRGLLPPATLPTAQDPRCQAGECQIVAAIERQLLDSLLLDHRTHTVGLLLDSGSRGHDLNHIGDVAELKLKVHSHDLAYVKPDIGLRGLKAGEAALYTVVAFLQERNRIESRVVRHNLSRSFRVQVYDGDFHTGDQGLRLIGHDTLDGRFLCPTKTNDQKRRNRRTNRGPDEGSVYRRAKCRHGFSFLLPLSL